MTTSEDSAIAAFVERVGLSAQADGLPRIAGRMLGYFVVYGGPCSFAELAEGLQVSRGSVSTNARILAGLGVIERTARPGNRQDFYQLASQPFARLIEGYVQRMQTMKANVAALQHDLPEDRSDAHERLAEMHGFYDAAVANTETLIAELRANNLTDARPADTAKTGTRP